MKFLMWQSLERWYFFAARLINRWCSYAESLIRSCWFGCKHYWNFFYCANLGDIDVSLLLGRWFVDDPLKRHFKTLINSMETFLIFIVFVVLTSESPIFLAASSVIRWWFSEVTYLKLWQFRWNFFDLYCFWFVNLWIIDVSLLLQWWFVDDTLKEHWWHYEDLDANSTDH